MLSFCSFIPGKILMHVSMNNAWLFAYNWHNQWSFLLLQEQKSFIFLFVNCMKTRKIHCKYLWGWPWISDNGYSAGVTPLFVKTTGERSVHSIYNKMYQKKKKEENFYEISVCSFFSTKYSEETPKRTPNRTTFSLGFKLNKIWPSKLNHF